MSLPLRKARFFLPVFLMLLAACGPAKYSTEQVAREPTQPPVVPTTEPAAVPTATAQVEESAAIDVKNEVIDVAQPVEQVGVDSDGSYFLGAADAPVTIVEYSDFQCPFCQRHSVETLPLLKEKFIDTGRLRYEFRDFPIASLHPLAYRLHEAAYCAAAGDGEQAYWQAHELFFSQAALFNVNSLADMDAAIASAFLQNGLSDVSDCVLNERFAAQVKANVADGTALGVSGTPSFFIDGFKISGAQPFEAFAQAIVAAEQGTLADVLNPPPAPAVDAAPIGVPTPVALEPRPKTGLGDPDAAVKIVEFSDYQCPFCQRHVLQTMPQLKQLIDDGRVYYEFKDFPIASLHPLAYKLHEATLCVQQYAGTSAFWQAHDTFFSRADALNQSDSNDMDAAIADELSRISMWPASVAECYQNRQFADEVAANIAEGERLGISGTPSFFINGYLLVGAQPYETFESAVALAEEGRLGDAMRAPGPADGKAREQATTAAQAVGQPVDVPLSGDEPVKGADDAPVTIIEYSSYQCPFCKRHFDQTMPSIQPYIDDGTVRYIFKDFPLPSQPQAFKVHEAAHCAHEQGGDDGYWAIHDIMFTNQAVWGGTPMGAHVDVIKELAKTADFLDGNAFDTCLDEGRYINRVNFEVQEGAALNVRGTPSFFINGQFISGAQPFAVFQQAIEDALQQE